MGKNKILYQNIFSKVFEFDYHFKANLNVKSANYTPQAPTCSKNY